MKKIYLKPVIKETSARRPHLLATSQVEVNGKYDGKTTVESRQFSGFDFDDEEE